MLYYYFGSKDGLYRAVLESNVEEFRRTAEEVLAGRGSAGTILLRYVGNHFDFIGARPYYPRLFQRVLMAGDRTMENLVRTHFLPLSRRLRELIQCGVASGELRPQDAHHTVISVIALTVFYFSAAPWIRKVGGVDAFAEEEQARRKEEVLKFIRYALFNNPDAAGE